MNTCEHCDLELPDLEWCDAIQGEACGECRPMLAARQKRRDTPYTWTVEIQVDPTWVQDGFDLDQDRLLDMLGRELGYARPHEYGGRVIKTPPADEIRAEQSGKKVGDYEPRIFDE